MDTFLLGWGTSKDTHSQQRTGSSSQCSKEEKEQNGVIGKEEIKVFLFSDYMFFHKKFARNESGWAENSFRFFHLRSSELMEKSEWTFWPTQYCKLPPTTV